MKTCSHRFFRVKLSQSCHAQVKIMQGEGGHFKKSSRRWISFRVGRLAGKEELHLLVPRGHNIQCHVSACPCQGGSVGF